MAARYPQQSFAERARQIGLFRYRAGPVRRDLGPAIGADRAGQGTSPAVEIYAVS